MDKILVMSWIEETGKSPSNALILLQKIQEKYGYLPREAMNLVVENTEISAKQLYGVATFYSQFRLKPVGKHLIKICHGTACHVRGAEKLSHAITTELKIPVGDDTSPDRKYTIEKVACVGCCSMAPVMVVDNELHGDLTGMKGQKIIKIFEKRENNE